MSEQPYCEAQVGGMECGQPVKKWGHQCLRHDPDGVTRRCGDMHDYGLRCVHTDGHDGLHIGGDNITSWPQHNDGRADA